MIKIAFFDTKEYDQKLFNEYNEKYGYEITYLESKLNKETAPLARGFDVVCIFVNDVVDKDTIEILKECGVKLIALRCAGFNNVDVKYIDDSIKVVRVPAYSPYAVAEHAVALLLSIDRKIYKAYQRTKKYNFTLNGLLGFDIHGKTVGVIGTGKIGKVFAKIMKGFGTRVIAYDVYKDENAAKEIGYEYVSLDELLRESDIVSLHCPLTDDTYKILNQETMAKMKKGVYIINTSRGKLIDTDSLIQKLEEGQIGGLGLDVYEDEEEFFLNDMSNSYIRDKDLSILLSMPNVVITSHQAFFTKEALNKIASDTFENIKDIFEEFVPNTMDAIVTNPPYRKINTGAINDNIKKIISRHEIECNLEDIISISYKLLKSKGEFYMVHRAERIVDIFYLLRKYKLEPKKVRFVQAYVDKSPNLVLIKAIKDAGEELRIERPLIVYKEENKYSDEILEIYNKKH